MSAGRRNAHRPCRRQHGHRVVVAEGGAGRPVSAQGPRRSTAPPEVIDWDQVTSFRFSFDRRQGEADSPVTHPELRLIDYVTGLRSKGRLSILSVDHLK